MSWKINTSLIPGYVLLYYFDQFGSTGDRGQPKFLVFFRPIFDEFSPLSAAFGCEPIFGFGEMAWDAGQTGHFGDF